MPFKGQFKDKYVGSLPENASVVRTLFDLFLFVSLGGRGRASVFCNFMEKNFSERQKNSLIQMRIWLV